jgi:hypothetical protein
MVHLRERIPGDAIPPRQTPQLLTQRYPVRSPMREIHLYGRKSKAQVRLRIEKSGIRDFTKRALAIEP